MSAPRRFVLRRRRGIAIVPRLWPGSFRERGQAGAVPNVLEACEGGACHAKEGNPGKRIVVRSATCGLRVVRKLQRPVRSIQRGQLSGRAEHRQQPRHIPDRLDADTELDGGQPHDGWKRRSLRRIACYDPPKIHGSQRGPGLLPEQQSVQFGHRACSWSGDSPDGERAARAGTCRGRSALRADAANPGAAPKSHGQAAILAMLRPGHCLVGR